MSKTIEIDYDTCEEITRETLIESYDMLINLQSISAVEHLENLECSQHLKHVIKYFSSQSQWKEFKAKYGISDL